MGLSTAKEQRGEQPLFQCLCAVLTTWDAVFVCLARGEGVLREDNPSGNWRKRKRGEEHMPPRSHQSSLSAIRENKAFCPLGIFSDSGRCRQVPPGQDLVHPWGPGLL